jgi:ribosome biogenesis GTPase A
MEKKVQPSATLLALLEGDNELIERLTTEASDTVITALNKAALLPVDKLEALAETLKNELEAGKGINNG